MRCDICDAPEVVLNVHPEMMKQAIQRGFNPITLGLIPAHLAALADSGSAARWEQSAIYGATSHTGWAVCADCLLVLAQYR